MAEAQRLGLHHRLDLDQRRRPAHLLQHHVLAAGFQRALEHQVLDEVRDDAVLALGGDDDEPLGARLGGLGGDQLDARRVDDRQQFLRHRLGRRQEPRPQAGGGNDRRARDRYLGPCRHRSHHNVITCLESPKAAKSPRGLRRMTWWISATDDEARIAGGGAAGPPRGVTRATPGGGRRARRASARGGAPGETVCAYVPVGFEPGSPAMLDVLVALGGRVLLPVAREDETGLPQPLQWGEYRAGGLVDARYGLREPAAPVAGRRGDRRRDRGPGSGPCGGPRRRPAGPRRRLLRPVAAAGRIRLRG